MDSKHSGLLNWLGFKSNLDFRRARVLGGFLGWLIAICILLALVIGLAGLVLLLGSMLGFGPFSGDPTAAAARNVGFVIVAIFGAPFVAWRAVIAQKQLYLSEQGQITDRINKAVQGLGAEKTVKRTNANSLYVKNKDGLIEQDESGNFVCATDEDGEPIVEYETVEDTQPNIEVRIGSVYALERLMKDSIEDHFQIMEVLCAYIRTNAIDNTVTKDMTHEDAEATYDLPYCPELREDLQTALTVVGRRGAERIAYEALRVPPYMPDLRGAHLNKAKLYGATLGPVLLDRSSWIHADLRRCNFSGCHTTEGCDFRAADLEGADFSKSSLDSVEFQFAQLPEATFCEAQLFKIDFSELELHYASFSNATLVVCVFDKAELIDTDFGVSAGFRNSFTDSFLFNTDFSVGCFNEANADLSRELDRVLGVRAGKGRTKIPKNLSYPNHWLDLSDLAPDYDALETYKQELTSWRSNRNGTQN